MSSTQPPDAAPADPPIPVPDVPGADAGARGLPRRVDLTLRQRLIVDTSAIADLGLRTALASVVGAAMVPQIALAALNGSNAKEQRDALRFYAELGAVKDAGLSFPTPTEVPRISSRPANPIAEWTANGRVHNI
ncbi:MAG TPA: alpha/beta hydrolase, partial [Mycobacterium sp.]|nr:alpha/beta hydrolase [Mycobacterium sp.]